jgi:tRNA threonylcarbamoyladenosine biosynthesis protein TsaB
MLLAVDTSGKQGSIALCRAVETVENPQGIEVLEVVPLAGGTFSAQLIPQIADLLSKFGHTKNDLTAFAVVSGPGSFTGLRIGLAAVKALGEVLLKPIAAVSLLEVCAFASGMQGKILAALDAGRSEVYVGEYELDSTSQSNSGERLLTRDQFLSEAQGRRVVTRDSAITEALQAAGISVMLVEISAADVAKLGWQKIQDGETVTPAQLEANYIRRTDAEMLERTGS